MFQYLKYSLHHTFCLVDLRFDRQVRKSFKKLSENPQNQKAYLIHLKHNKDLPRIYIAKKRL